MRFRTDFFSFSTTYRFEIYTVGIMGGLGFEPRSPTPEAGILDQAILSPRRIYSFNTISEIRLNVVSQLFICDQQRAFKHKL